ncbi:MAG: diguanylate cyclase, partial [Polyangiales bacterium]
MRGARVPAAPAAHATHLPDVGLAASYAALFGLRLALTPASTNAAAAVTDGLHAAVYAWCLLAFLSCPVRVALPFTLAACGLWWLWPGSPSVSGGQSMVVAVFAAVGVWLRRRLHPSPYPDRRPSWHAAAAAQRPRTPGGAPAHVAARPDAASPAALHARLADAVPVADACTDYPAALQAQWQTTLQLLTKALDLHAAHLLQVRGNVAAPLATQASATAPPFPDAMPLDQGVFAALGRTPLRLRHTPPRITLPYYASPPAVTLEALVVPLHDDAGTLVAVMCLDRLAPAFSAADERVALDAGSQLLHILASRTVVAALERSRQEQASLHEAATALSAAQGQAEIAAATFAALKRFVPYDFAAITRVCADGESQEVAFAAGERHARFCGQRYADARSLTAMAVHTRHYLPGRQGGMQELQQVFSPRMPLHGMRSVLVLPLVRADAVQGTLVVACKQADALGDPVRQTLIVFSHQLATALSHAVARERLAAEATTDALTGCLNKRMFLQTLATRLRAAHRFGRPLSLVIIDLDHFKRINDTHGHAAGDAVLRRLGALMLRLKRESDCVGRFGGEEFCLLCESTDAEGAAVLAERLREEVAHEPFDIGACTLSVTASLGVATFPRDACDVEALFEAADEALYQAKQQGRDQEPGGAAVRDE